MKKKLISGWKPTGSASFWINRASRALLRVQDASLRSLGFGMSQMPVLHALQDGTPRSQKDLAACARVEQPTMAEMLARMERDGVIERKPNPDDGRGTLASLTKQSRARWSKGKAALMKSERNAVAGFTTQERKLLLDLLQRIVANLEDDKSCLAE